MADAVISVVVERAAAILEDQIRYEVNLVRGVENEVRDLNGKLETIKNVLDDAEKKGVEEETVKKWLRKLGDTAYEMDDILDEWEYALKKHQVELAAVASAKRKVSCSFIPSSSCLCFKKVVVRRDIGMKIRNVEAKLDQILKEKDDFSFVMSQPPTEPKPPRVQSTSFIELEKVYGHDIDRNKNDIVTNIMLNNGDGQLVLSIVGMGGIGKTTLAQLVYNDDQVLSCFRLRIWISVSDRFDVAGIASAIVASVGIHSIPSNNNQLELVLQKLRDSVSGKKFILVLDDVWTEKPEEWEPLKNILKYGAEGSTIMVTTRNEGVAKMMGTFDNDIYQPQLLSDKECWSLLSLISHSRRSVEECGKFEDVGKKIAKKCRGLPLAAKVLGSLLQGKRSLEEWEGVLDSEIWRLGEAKLQLFPHLLLSYNELSPSLKRCFSYCSIYPKDYRVNAESLIEEWMALGYLGSVAGNNRAKVKGRDDFNDLARRSLFQDFERSGEFSEEIEWCKMHDIVHDFVKYLRKKDDSVPEASEMTTMNCGIHDPLLVSKVQEYRSLFWDERTPPNLCECVTSLRVLRFERTLESSPHGMEKLIHMRWLELSGTKLSNEDLKIICRLYFLQTLLLELCSLQEISDEIGNLVHLRHLNLKNNFALEKLPESLCSLVELEILNVERCSRLEGLPEGIHKLKNLQHLHIQESLVCECFPQGLAELSGLRTLREFMGGSNLNKLGLLKTLNRLSGSLSMNIRVRSFGDLEVLAEDAREATLREKNLIQRLKLQFENETDANWSSLSSSLWMDVIEALEPNQNLKELHVLNYMGSRLPFWISSLRLIKKITLEHFGQLASLPPLGKLPLLEHLQLRDMNALEEVGREFLGIECSSSSSTNRPVVAFPKLQKLKFFSCEQWRKWEDITAEEEESGDISIMPCLTHLTVECCGSLKKLPRLLVRMAYSLQVLNISNSQRLIVRYGHDEHGRYGSSMFHNNRQLDLFY